MNRPLSYLQRQEYIETVGGTRSRGASWRITPSGARAATRLWSRDLDKRVHVGRSKISVSALVETWKSRFPFENTPERLVCTFLTQDWLPFLHSSRQNRHLPRGDYNPYGILEIQHYPERWASATTLVGTALCALEREYETKQKIASEGTEVLYTLMLLADDKEGLMRQIVTKAFDIGLQKDSILATLEALSGRDVPNPKVRAAAFSTRFWLKKNGPRS